MTPVEEDKVGIFLIYIKEEEETLRKERNGLVSHKISPIKMQLYKMHLSYPAQQECIYRCNHVIIHL